MNLPKGWPTEAMLAAGREATRNEGFWNGAIGNSDLESIFTRMLAAAPTPPAQEDEPRLVSYGIDLETCTLNYRGEEYYFERASTKEQEDEPVATINRVEMFSTVHIQADLNERGEDLPDETPLYTRPQPATVISGFLQQDPSTIPTTDEHNALLVEQIEELRESLEAHRDNAQKLVEDRNELVKALREMREEADTYFMKEQIEKADRILAKYQETDNDTPSR